MAENKEKTVTGLVGDFYEGHAAGNREKMNTTLAELDALLMTGEAAHLEFIEYFNGLFSGRTAYNTLLGVKEYPVESVIRELLQNAFDCDYEQEDIKIGINFKDNQTISISYNEVGFILEQFMFYLSFGRNTKNVTSSEGRFGVGAKSVFMNVEWLSMRSNNFSFCITNNSGHLKITDINLRRPIFKGTEMVIKVSAEEHKRIKDNFVNLTVRKGDYINIMELCFAFNRKKILNNAVSKEFNENRTFNIAVMHNGKLIDFYKIFNHLNKHVNVNVLRFTQGGKSVVDFICYENEGFVCLIPFAVAVSRRADLVGLLSDKYNYFSTYELTGLLQDENSTFASEKLSAFFISVPNQLITSFRTGIRPDREAEVVSRVEESLRSIIKEYERFFVLEIVAHQNGGGLYYLRPESYAFEFIKNFILTCKIVQNQKKDFLRAVSLRYSRDEAPLHYTELQKNAFFSKSLGVSKEDHLDGSAYDELILDKLDRMNENLSDIGSRILYAGYEWEGELDGDIGIVYAYEFHKDGKMMTISSEDNPAGTDYDLHDGFRSMTECILEKALGGNKLISEERFIKLITVLDEVYAEEYKIALKEKKLCIVEAGEEFLIETTGMKITDIAGLMSCLNRHRQSFLTYQDYSETAALVFGIFAAGKKTIDFLRALKAQALEITLRQDLAGKYCFAVYETLFPIPDDMPAPELLEIIEDISLLIKYGVLKGRSFGFPYGESRYNFEPQKIAKLLATESLPAEMVTELLGGIYAAGLKAERIALLGEKDLIIDIIDYKTGLIPEDAEKCQKAQKFIVLRDDSTKEEFADLIELIITGEVKDIMRKRYLGAKAAKIVIPDQFPYYMKPLPIIKKEEFKYLREIVKGITTNNYSARNFYAKDINSKLFGYGGVCSFCKYESNGLNGFAVKDFEAMLMHEGKERQFFFSLYLCANDALVCDSWVIDDLVIGGKSPFIWLEEVIKAETISLESLFSTMTYREQFTHDIGKTDNEGWNPLMSPPRTAEIILSPLMIASWVEKNTETPKKPLTLSISGM
ncbi:MAG: ATP-binding protein [Oscillospiraceae bacterium]|nr:ATP-binding protein [Oscillospiraceae bacterium]